MPSKANLAAFLLQSVHSIYLLISTKIKVKSKTGGRKTMKEKRRYFYLDDFEHRLLVGCLMTARNEYLHEGKPTEDVNELINISQSLSVAFKAFAALNAFLTISFDCTYSTISGDNFPEAFSYKS